MMLGMPELAVAADDAISSRLAEVLAQPAGPFLGEDGIYGVWVKFDGRNLKAGERDARLAEAGGNLSAKALERRGKAVRAGEKTVSEIDLPVAPEFLDTVMATGAEFRRESRWLNMASFNATAEQIDIIKDLPFVTGVDLVARFKKRPVDLSEEDIAKLEKARSERAGDKNNKWTLDYGSSLEQAEIINLPPVHELGLSGRGVIVGLIDTGWEFTHEALQNVDVLAAYDFVNDDPDVSDGPGDPEGQAQHGTQALSLIAGFKEGDLVGTAHKASFILAKTEDIASESPLEEDNFIAAIEWMEGLGVDVVSSQVGYVDWYYNSDLDGVTAAITIAADMAATLGVTVVTAAGNLTGMAGVPPMMAPADGRHVITVGSVSLDGNVVATSSRGPTWDGRIKPDLMAMGFGPVGATWYNDWVYPYVSGTSYATVQVAGVATLMLERLPNLTPWQVREAMRMTASRADFPDNDYGWGLANARAAIDYWGPVINHEPLGPFDATTSPRTVIANVTARQGVMPGSVVMSWRLDNGSWQRKYMTEGDNGEFSGTIPPAIAGTFIEYYVEAVDMGGMTLSHPLAGSAQPHGYTLGSDATAPILDHVFLMDQLLVEWPPVVRARATDDVGVASVDLFYSANGAIEQGPFVLTTAGDDYELDFPLDPSGLVSGSTVTYRLVATDISGNGNATESGPYDFEIVSGRGHILIIDDLSENKTNQEDSGSLTDKTFQSPLLIEGWLNDAGYTTDMIRSSQVKEGSFVGYDAVVLSSGQSFFPVTYDEVRNQLVSYEAAGGRILVEGGETGYVSGINPGYPEFFEKVLHSSTSLGEGGYTFHPTMGMEDHVFMHRPHPLPETLSFGLLPGQIDYRVSDLNTPTPDAGVLYSSYLSSQGGGVIFHDDNTGPDQGQVVYLSFAVNFLKEAVARMMVENAMAYLLTEELPGRSAITGQVLLAGQTDHSGITVSTDSLHVTVTDTEGNYTLEGLWGGEVFLTAEFAGYGAESQAITLVDDQVYPADPMTLNLTSILDLENTTPYPIPDNDPVGIDSPIDVAATGSVHAIKVTVDISHYSINNLIVKLISPAGTEVTLHNRSGGTADNIVGSWPDILTVDGPGALEDFHGEDVQGRWVLNVSDNQFGAIGTLNSWGLTIEVGAAAPTPDEGDFAKKTKMLANAPNPFNPRTVIAFELGRPGPVRLNIFDLRGRLVRSLVDGEMPAGGHQVTWDGLDRAGKAAASGIYFTKLVAEGATQVHKMTLVR
jgi:subtilisin-like proprotein convertase family protein